MGLRTFKPLQEKKAAAKAKKSKASLKQYREKDGLFYFKLVNGQGKTLLTAGGLPSGKEVGAHLQSFKASGLGALKDIFCQLDAEATEAEVQSARRADSGIVVLEAAEARIRDDSIELGVEASAAKSKSQNSEKQIPAVNGFSAQAKR